MYSKIEDMGHQLTEAFMQEFIFGGVDLNFPQDEGKIKDIPDELVVEIFFKHNPENVAALMATSHRFMKLGMGQSAIFKYVHKIWPWLWPKFSPEMLTKALPSTKEVQKTMYETLSKELKTLGISEQYAGLTMDPKSFREVNRLIEAVNFCIFFSFVIEDSSLFLEMHQKFETPTQIFALEKKYRKQLDNLDYSSIKEIFAIRGISAMELTRIPEEIGKFENLVLLKCHGHRLFYLPKSINNLQKLTELDLSINEFTSFPEVICNLKSLEGLYIRQNDILEIPESIGNLENLEVLALPNASIASLPLSMKKLHNLQVFMPENYSSDNTAAIENQKIIIEQLHTLLPNCRVEES